MAKEKVEIYLSSQAKGLLSRMPGIDEKALVDWFAKVRKISIGGGDVCEYVKHLDEKKGES